MQTNKIQVEVIINGSLETVWGFWNNPEKIKLWAFASDDWECPYAENNLVLGGKFITRMAAKDKSASFDFSGTYTGISEYSKISYVMSPDEGDLIARKCDIEFKDIGEGKTMIIEKFDPETENSEEVQKIGWQNILNNFKKLVETTQA